MNKKLSFEKALKQLEEIVYTLETEDISLQKALKDFEAGIKLVNLCGQQLENAEKKIEFLSEENKKGSPN